MINIRYIAYVNIKVVIEVNTKGDRQFHANRNHLGMPIAFNMKHVIVCREILFSGKYRYGYTEFYLNVCMCLYVCVFICVHVCMSQMSFFLLYTISLSLYASSLYFVLLYKNYAWFIADKLRGRWDRV